MNTTTIFPLWLMVLTIPTMSWFTRARAGSFGYLHHFFLIKNKFWISHITLPRLLSEFSSYTNQYKVRIYHMDNHHIHSLTSVQPAPDNNNSLCRDNNPYSFHAKSSRTYSLSACHRHKSLLALKHLLRFGHKKERLPIPIIGANKRSM